MHATVNISLTDRARAIDEIIRACENAGVIGAGFHHANGSGDRFGVEERQLPLSAVEPG